MISAASVAAFRRDLDRVLRRGLRRLTAFPHSKEMGEVLFSAGRTYADAIARPTYFYARAIPPKRGYSRSRGAARRSVRALGGAAAQRLAGARVARGYTPRTVAAVIGGDKPGTTHLRVLEVGRRERTVTPGATGALPGQHIFRDARKRFAGLASKRAQPAARRALKAFVARAVRVQ